MAKTHGVGKRPNEGSDVFVVLLRASHSVRDVSAKNRDRQLRPGWQLAFSLEKLREGECNIYYAHIIEVIHVII